MNQVDLFILLVLTGSAVSGARRGLVGAGGDVLSLFLGLALGSIAYPVGSAVMRLFLGSLPALADALGFVAIAALVVAGASWGLTHAARRVLLPPLADRVGGAALGAVFGLVLAAVLVLASGMLSGAAEPVERSLLGGRTVKLVPRLHSTMERVGFPLPKLIQLPADYRDEIEGGRRQFRFARLNFTALEGAMCLHCREPVRFDGYHFSRGLLLSPKFSCPGCGRTSDGCQTFEGFHTIYRDCPVTPAEEGLEFDCGVWTNGWRTVPHGPCPVCGRELRRPAGERLPVR